MSATLELKAPLSGILIPIEDVPDPVFAGKMVGDGVGLDPTSSTLLAPCAGKVKNLHKAHHAITLETPGGVEVLMHIGLETVALKAVGFKPLVEVGQEVQTGTPLIEFDADLIAQKARSLITMMVIVENPAVTGMKPARGPARAGQDVVLSVQLAGSGASSASSTGPEEAGPWLKLTNPHGLHARPAARLAALAKTYPAQTWLECARTRASARSVVGLMAMELSHGEEVRLVAAGERAAEAVAELSQAIRDGLGEGTDEHPQAPPPPEKPREEQPGCYSGVVASPGLALGVVYHWTHQDRAVPETGGPAPAESRHLEEAIARARQQILGLNDGEGIFQAHLELLSDPELSEQAQGAIGQGKSAAFAWKAAYRTQMEALQKLSNPLLAARATDLRDVGDRVLGILLGDTEPVQRSFPADCVVLAHDLTPSDTVQLDRSRVRGIATVGGGSTSHVAILARAMDLPALCAVSPDLLKLAEGRKVLLDARQGLLRYELDEAQESEARAQIQALQEQRARERQEAHLEAKTQDGRHIELGVNVTGVEEIRDGLSQGADGVGLLRTEFLFHDRKTAPNEDEQHELYRQMLDALEHRRTFVVRLLDVGGDKPLSYCPMPAEENPFLGIRGVRLLLRRAELFDQQLKAILRASQKGKVSILVPMISTAQECLDVRARIEQWAERIGGCQYELGVMIEVPSAALIAERLAPLVDFFSIGTNDLTQYVLAVDRGHSELAGMVDALHPAVLALIEAVCKAAHKHGKWTGVCGGAAGDIDAVPLLVGLGVGELSVSPASVPTIKALVRKLKFADCQKLAQEALGLAEASQVRDLVRGAMA